MYECIGTTKNGMRVVFDREHSHAATHCAQTPGLLEVVRSLIPETEPRATYERMEFDLERIVGECDLVETTSKDEIVYAQRRNRDTYTRFVKNRTSTPTSWVTAHFKQKDENTYELFTAYPGRITPPEPGNEHETSESRPFWERHALVWGSQKIVPDTETKECPW